MAPVVSPDGLWMAYVSNESGRAEVHVRAFPGMEGRTQVSLEGGTEPLWSRDGRELFYRSGAALHAAECGTQRKGTRLVGTRRPDRIELRHASALRVIAHANHR